MMDKDAAVYVAELAQSAHAAPATGVPTCLLPGDSRIHSLEKFELAPVRLRQTVQFTRIEDFCRYVEKNSLGDMTNVYISDAEPGAEAIIDAGSNDSPMWGDHIAKLAPPLLPEYGACLRVNGGSLSQIEMIDFAEDWGDSLTVLDKNGEQISHAAMIEWFRKVDTKAMQTITSEEQDFETKRSSMEEIEIKAYGKAHPSEIRMRCTPIEGMSQYDVRMRVRGLTSGEKPRFSIRIIGFESLKKEVADEVESLISSGVPQDVLKYVGTFNNHN